MTAETGADARAVLAIPAFRRLWTALALSSFGDWLGLLALTTFAASLSGGGYAEQNVAIAGVFILRLAPAVVLGPIAGAVADRLDRRLTMVVCDVLRFLLVLSIPLVGQLWWLYVATLLIECAALFWIPAKEATVPNLVPRDRLESANQVSLLATYGAAPVAAAAFALLTVAGGPLSRVELDAVELALVFDACTFLVAAATIWTLRVIPGRVRTEDAPTPTVWATIVEGWRFVGRSPVVRGLVVGMLGAFAAGGAVVGLARTHVTDLGGGNPAYGVLFAAVFVGLAAGMGLGPRLVGEFSRRRLFGTAIACAGTVLVLIALSRDLVLTALLTLLLGGFTGVAWVTGYTLVGLTVADELRGRTFAFVQSMTRVVLVAVLALAPLVAAAIGRPHVPFAPEDVRYTGSAVVFAVAGLLAVLLGLTSYRQMDDRRGVPLLADVLAVLRGTALPIAPGWPSQDAAGRQARQAPTGPPGLLVALEGGDGSGKSTQARLLVEWLEGLGHEAVLTREPGSTAVGQRIRALLLDPAGEPLAPRAEALLYGADRAHHVATVVRPALQRGAVVVTDRFVDSSLAYQAGGRGLSDDDVAGISRFATDGLRPGLTVLLDLPAEAARARRGADASRAGDDRLEGEPDAFHERVRQRYLALAAADPERYLVVDATLPADAVADAVRRRLAPLLPEVAAPQVEATPVTTTDRPVDAAAGADAAVDSGTAGDGGVDTGPATEAPGGATAVGTGSTAGSGDGTEEAVEVAGTSEEQAREAERLRAEALRDARRQLAAERQRLARVQEVERVHLERAAAAAALAEEERQAVLREREQERVRQEEEAARRAVERERERQRREAEREEAQRREAERIAAERALAERVEAQRREAAREEALREEARRREARLRDDLGDPDGDDDAPPPTLADDLFAWTPQPEGRSGRPDGGRGRR